MLETMILYNESTIKESLVCTNGATVASSSELRKVLPVYQANDYFEDTEAHGSTAMFP